MRCQPARSSEYESTVSFWRDSPLFWCRKTWLRHHLPPEPAGSSCSGWSRDRGRWSGGRLPMQAPWNARRRRARNVRRQLKYTNLEKLQVLISSFCVLIVWKFSSSGSKRNSIFKSALDQNANKSYQPSFRGSADFNLFLAKFCLPATTEFGLCGSQATGPFIPLVLAISSGLSCSRSSTTKRLVFETIASPWEELSSGFQVKFARLSILYCYKLKH